MGGHGHGEPYKIPDASIYKVEDVPLLREVKEALARQGLKDPWLRNEVWRYGLARGTHRSRAIEFFTRGILYGFGLFLVTIGGEYAYGLAKGEDHHGHHEEHKKH